MAVQCALRTAEFIVELLPRYSSADHIAIFRALLALLAKCLRGGGDKFEPYFGDVVTVDSLVERLLELERQRLFFLNMETSLERSYWRVTKEYDVPRIRLAKPMRRSALHLLSNKASYLSYPSELRRAVRGTERSRPKPKRIATLEAGLELAPLTEGVQSGWDAFAKQTGLSVGGFASFQVFFASLNESPAPLWHSRDDIESMWRQFERSNPARPSMDFDRLLSLFASDVEEAQKIGLAVPFIHIGGWYLRWPYFFHTLHPSLSCLALALRRHSDVWSHTVGSQSSLVADYVAGRLGMRTDVNIKVRVQKKAVGDMDIVALDRRRNELLICEVKTVFDRFRTNYQLGNFADQRVNFEKAIKQLRRCAAAIQEGSWPLSSIFEGASGAPSSIHLLVLTWWDIFNPMLGTGDEDVLACNFVTFEYLWKEANGNVADVCAALRELSSSYCVGRLHRDTLVYEDGETEYLREVQTDVLPPADISRRAWSRYLIFGLGRSFVRGKSPWYRFCP
jgi:hypothetical protein